MSKKHMSSSEQEIEKAKEQFDAFDQNVKDLTLDRMNAAPKQETEPTHRLSQNQIANSKDIYLKPNRSIGSAEKFNENYREDYDFAKEYVQFMAEHKEIIGETIEIWTKNFAGVPAEYWLVPTGKPVWGPRYLAEQLKRCNYHRLKMDEAQSTGGDGAGRYYGAMSVDTTIQRLDAIPVSKRKSFFMGASGF